VPFRASAGDAPGSDWFGLYFLGNLATFQKITELPVASQVDRYFHQGQSEGWRGDVRKNVSIPPGLVNGKHVLLRLKPREDDEKPTWFFVDDASLQYTQWGLGLGD